MSLFPRNALGSPMPTARAQPPQDIAELDGWLHSSESVFPDLKPGNAKGIVWGATPGQRTPWALVYLHGFSASRMETAPLTEAVAAQLGANVFYTRLTGHGLADGGAMGEARVQDWMTDTLEAVRIGQTLGERVLLIGCSTGATLATWLGMSADASRVNACVFVSPNFGLKDRRSAIINLPWGQKLALWIQGSTKSWTPKNAEEAGAWTSSYPTKALFPMMALIQSVRASDLRRFRTPLLVLYSARDETVEPAKTLAAFARLGSAHKTLERVDYSKSQGQHVLAGAIKDLAAVTPMSDSIIRWLKTLPGEPS